MGIAYNTSIVRDGLVLHLDAANVKSYPGSGTDITDTSTYKIAAGLYNGASYDANEKSFLFDGTDDNIGILSIPSHLELMANKSLCFFVKSNGTGDLGAALIRAGLGYDLIYSLFFHRVDKKIYYHWYDGSSFQAVYSSNNVVSINQWHYCCCSVEGTAITFYVDGVSVGTGSVTTPQGIIASSRIGIGATRSGTSTGTTAQDFGGHISVAQIYNRALSQSEIRQNFEAMRGRYGI